MTALPNPGWILAGALLALFMVHAMMQFTVSLLVRKPAPKRQPLTADELKERLRALNESGHAFRLIEGGDSDFELHWDLVDAAWRRRFATVKVTEVYRARILVEPADRTVKMNEYLRTGHLFLGFDGWIPRFSGSIYFFSGFVSGYRSGMIVGMKPGFPPRIGEVRRFSVSTDEAREAVAEIVTRSGWTLRPVIFWFEATHGGARWIKALTPPPLRDMPLQRFWAIVYPLSYIAAVAALVIAAGGLGEFSVGDWGLVALISVAWWGAWGLMTWFLMGTPRFWRRSPS